MGGVTQTQVRNARLITIMKAIYLSSLNGHATGRVRRLVHNRLVRASSASNHWSSTENNQNNAWNVNFSNGNMNNNNKYNSFVGSIVNAYRIRLIRRTMASLYRSVLSLERVSLLRTSGKAVDDAHYLSSINSLLGFTVHTNDFDRKRKLFTNVQALHQYYTITKLSSIKRNKQYV